jgi:3-phenylpropionate/trans-cinnamate dioxygenase ferredoxin reductase component
MCFNNLLIVGGGQAAAQTVESVRAFGFTGAITLVSEEGFAPYQRPPLSKQYLAGRHPQEWLLYRPLSFYARHQVSIRLNSRAVRIDRHARTVELESAEMLAYDRLVLATGARARRLSIPGGDNPSVVYLRDARDAQRIVDRLRTARRVIVVGGGFIGVEVAAVLVQIGHEVHLLTGDSGIMPRLGCRETSEFFADRHRAHGVRITFNISVEEFRAMQDGSVELVSSGGDRFTGDLIIVGIGAVPNDELAVEAGLACDDGIVVDEFTVSSDPSILSAGDCARHPNAWKGKSIRLETVHNAVEQSKATAATLMGRSLPYRQVPWVWSDQYTFRLQSVGFHDRYDRSFTRGDPESGPFSRFYFDGENFTGAHFVNRPREFGACRRILNGRARLTVEQVRDTNFDLDVIAPRRPALTFDRAWSSNSRGGSNAGHNE